MLGRLCLMVFTEKLESEMRTLGKLRMLRSTLCMLSLPLHGLIWSGLLCIGVLIILSNTLGYMDLLSRPSRSVGVQVLK